MLCKSTPNSEGEISRTGDKHFRIIIENNIQNCILVSFESIFYFLSSVVENPDVSVITSNRQKSAWFVETDRIGSIRTSVILSSVYKSYFTFLWAFWCPKFWQFHLSRNWQFGLPWERTWLCWLNSNVRREWKHRVRSWCPRNWPRVINCTVLSAEAEAKVLV